MKTLSGCLMLLLVLHGLASGATVSDTQAVTLTVTPPVYQDVLTRDVTVNCTLPRANSTQFANVISLIMSKTDPGNDNTYMEIASVTEYSHDNPDVRNASMGGHASGHVAPNTDAYLAMHWGSPNSSVSGRYKCEAFGVDRLGHPLTSKADIVIVENPVDLSGALNKVKELYTAIDDLNRWKTFSQKILANCNTGDSFFHGTSYYTMIGPASYSLTTGQAACRSLGGYLAEVNDKEEYQRLQSFVTQKLTTNDVLLGASDEAKEGSWVYANSSKPVTFTDWGPSFSGSNRYNCMALTRQSSRWRMEDLGCASSNRYLLCEMRI